MAQEARLFPGERIARYRLKAKLFERGSKRGSAIKKASLGRP